MSNFAGETKRIATRADGGLMAAKNRLKTMRIMKLTLMVLALMLTTSACHGQSDKQEKKMKTLVVYFSQSGNTEGIAKRVAEATGGDLEQLETVTPYTGSYQQIVAEAQDEVERDYQRPIKPLKHDVSQYDRIVVGTPTWWYKMASPVLTFLATTDFSGKVVVPFMTNAGWPGTVIDDMTREAEANGAMVEKAHEFRFHTLDNGVTTGMATSQRELDKWVESL